MTKLEKAILGIIVILILVLSMAIYKIESQIDNYCEVIVVDLGEPLENNGS